MHPRPYSINNPVGKRLLQLSIALPLACGAKASQSNTKDPQARSVGHLQPLGVLIFARYIQYAPTI